MKTKMGFRHKFAYSFFDFTAYKEFLVQGLGKSIVYIFLVTLIFSTIGNINTINTFNSELSSIQYDLENIAPNFELKNGVLSVASDEPIYYKYDGLSFVVDTNGKTNSSVLDSYSDAVYINSNEIILKQNYKTVQTVQFTNFAELIVTNEIAKSSLALLRIIFPIMLLIFNPMLSFLENLISAFLILGPLSIFISSSMGLKLNYSRACTLSFYAMTFPLLLEALLHVAGIFSPEFFILFYIVAAAYCGLAIKEIKNIDKSNLNFMK